MQHRAHDPYRLVVAVVGVGDRTRASFVLGRLGLLGRIACAGASFLFILLPAAADWRHGRYGFGYDPIGCRVALSCSGEGLGEQQRVREEQVSFIRLPRGDPNAVLACLQLHCRPGVVDVAMAGMRTLRRGGTYPSPTLCRLPLSPPTKATRGGSVQSPHCRVLSAKCHWKSGFPQSMYFRHASRRASSVAAA